MDVAGDDRLPADRLLDYGRIFAKAGEVARSGAAYERALDLAEGSGDEALAAWTRALQASLAGSTNPNASGTEALEAARRAIPLLEQKGDRARLSDAITLAGFEEFWLCRAGASIALFERALREAEQIGDVVRADDARTGLAVAHLYGPVPVSRAIPRLEEMARELEGRAGQAWTLAALGLVRASAGDVEEGRKLVERGMDVMREFGQRVPLASGHPIGALETLAGRPEAVVERLEPGVAELEALGQTGFGATTAGWVAEAYVELGELQAAEDYATRTRSWANEDDISAQMQWRRAMSLVRALRGDLLGATALAEEAVALAGDTDYLDQRAETFETQSKVAEMAGDLDLALRAAREALDSADRRENVVLGERLRRRVELLGGDSASG
jgi:tetratricopeptide (TPR) repeat protein